METDHVETKHVETKHVETKHVETKHLETDHLETEKYPKLSKSRTQFTNSRHFKFKAGKMLGNF